MTTATDLLRTQLLACLDETFEHVHGSYLDRHTSMVETLEDVSAAEASRAIGNGRATVAAHVEHVRLYLDVLDEVMRTQRITTTDWRAIWQTVHAVTPEQWDGQRLRLRESYGRVVATISACEEWTAPHALSGALGVIAHSAYHLGAIRQVLGAVRAANAQGPAASGAP